MNKHYNMNEELFSDIIKDVNKWMSLSPNNNVQCQIYLDDTQTAYLIEFKTYSKKNNNSRFALHFSDESTDIIFSHLMDIEKILIIFRNLKHGKFVEYLSAKVSQVQDAKIEVMAYDIRDLYAILKTICVDIIEHDNKKYIKKYFDSLPFLYSVQHILAF